MNDGVIMEIYDNVKEMETFNGFHVFTIDGSYVEIQIIHKHVKKWEYHKIMIQKHLLQMQEYRTVDTKMDFVVSSIIDSQTVDK